MESSYTAPSPGRSTTQGASSLSAQAQPATRQDETGGNKKVSPYPAITYHQDDHSQPMLRFLARREISHEPDAKTQLLLSSQFIRHLSEKHFGLHGTSISSQRTAVFNMLYSVEPHRFQFVKTTSETHGALNTWVQRCSFSKTRGYWSTETVFSRPQSVKVWFINPDQMLYLNSAENQFFMHDIHKEAQGENGTTRFSEIDNFIPNVQLFPLKNSKEFYISNYDKYWGHCKIQSNNTLTVDKLAEPPQDNGRYRTICTSYDKTLFLCDDRNRSRNATYIERLTCDGIEVFKLAFHPKPKWEKLNFGSLKPIYPIIGINFDLQAIILRGRNSSIVKVWHTEQGKWISMGRFKNYTDINIKQLSRNTWLFQGLVKSEYPYQVKQKCLIHLKKESDKWIVDILDKGKELPPAFIQHSLELDDGRIIVINRHTVGSQIMVLWSKTGKSWTDTPIHLFTGFRKISDNSVLEISPGVIAVGIDGHNSQVEPGKILIFDLNRPIGA